METASPGEPEKVQLLKAGIGNLEVSWNPVSTGKNEILEINQFALFFFLADSYILQIQRFEAPADQTSLPPPILPTIATAATPTPVNPTTLPLQSISASLFASKSPQSVLASLIPTFNNNNNNNTNNNEQQTPSASVSAISDSDAVVDSCLSSTTNLTKSASDLLSFAHLSSSQTGISSSISTVNAQTLPSVSLSPSNSTNLFQKPTTTTAQTVRSPNIQFLNANSSNATVRPIIFHQKPSANSPQPQLLTVMPAGVRVQQLTPVVRAATNQPTTIVRLMSPATTTVRPGTTPGQQQIIQLNTNKQQQPLVIKAITAQTSANRPQQQPIVLTTNAPQQQQQQQQQQQVLVLNQNSTGQQPKFTLQMANVDHSQHESNNEPTTTTTTTTTTPTPSIPQLDGSVDDQVSSLSIQNGTTTTGKSRLDCL